LQYEFDRELRSLARQRWDKHHLRAEQAQRYRRFAAAIVLGFGLTYVLGNCCNVRPLRHKVARGENRAIRKLLGNFDETRSGIKRQRSPIQIIPVDSIFAK
jgi:hypothetical protein